MKLRLSILTSVFLITLLFFPALQRSVVAQDTVSLGCCKTVEGTPSCVGCGDGGANCAIDGSLCVETNSFTLGEYCIDSTVAEQAECRVAESKSGCCVVSEGQCSDDESFNTCAGHHWFEGTECSSVPPCASPVASSGFIDWIILAGAFVVVIFLLMKFRRKRHGR